MSNILNPTALESLRQREREAAEDYAAWQIAQKEWEKAGANPNDPKFEAVLRLKDAYELTAYRTEELQRQMGLYRGSMLPIPGDGFDASDKLVSFFQENKDRMGPSGGKTIPSLIELALSQPASGFQAALDGGNLGVKGRPVQLFSELPRRPLSILDLIPLAGTLDELAGTVLEYFKVTTRTNLAAAVAKLGAKPESVLTVSRESTTLFKYAHISEQVPQEFLVGQSGGALKSFIETDMAMSVMEAFETACISGGGTTTVDGITHVSGTLTQPSSGDPLVDIRRAVTQLNLANIAADAIVLHPNDAETIDLQIDGDGNYYLGGPLGENPTRLWRIPVFVSTGLTEGTAIVGAFRDGMVRWSGISQVEWVRLNDDAKYNAYRLVAEAGAGAAVVRPGNFVKVTIP